MVYGIHGRLIALAALTCGVLLLALWLLEANPPGPPVCADSLGCVDIPPEAPLRLGAIQSLSGAVARLGQEQMRGLELALEDRNWHVLGHAVDLVVKDTGCQTEGGAIAALAMVADPSVVAIFGTTCSADAAAAAEVMAEAGLSMISGNNSAPFLTSMGGVRAPKWQPGFFRTANNEEHAGPAAARYAYAKLGIRAAVTIDDGDIYTRGLAEGFRKEFTRLGGVILRADTVNKGDADMGPVLEAAVQAKAQLIFFPLFQPEGNLLLKQARAMPALRDVVLMSDGSLIESSFLADVGALATGMYFVGPKPPDPSGPAAKLQRRYVERFKEEPATVYYQSAYDAARILFAAIERVAVKLPGAGLRIGRQALRDALYGTRDFPGVTGTLRCDQFGDCGLPYFNVLELKDPAQGIIGLQANVKYTYAPGGSDAP